MKIANNSVHVHWDRRYPKAGTTDLCPVQLGIRIDTVSFKVGLKLFATKNDFERAMSGKGGTAEQKELRSEINKHVVKAEEILKNLPNPSRELFQRMFKSEADLFRSGKRNSVDFHFELYIENLKKEERIKTAYIYTLALRSFKAYRTNLFFEEIDEAFLKGYCNFMLGLCNSMTTCQIYLRSLRAIYNKAIKEGYVAKRFYPFNTYVIGTSVKSKNVLYPEHMKLLLGVEKKKLRERRSLDYFLFSYLCNGMNFKDVVYLKWKNVQRDAVVFVREKTKRTNKVSGKEIRAYLHPEMQRIIETWGKRSDDPEDFVFPILHGYDTAAEREKRRDYIQRQVNDNLKVLGKRAGIATTVNLNIARHSFSTNLKLNGTPTSFITDALGHADGKTTEHYLKSIPDQHMKVISQSLLNF